jgi:prepilin-type N-terminal cleavage/methylation domain-containing protein
MRRHNVVSDSAEERRVRPISGFTLIELVVVVSIVGIVAAIATKQMGHTQVKAYVSAMKADLRNFALAEESYFYDNGVYASSDSMIGAAGFVLTPAVSITVNEATKSGWSATAEHQRTGIKCYLFSESAAPIGAATEVGNLVCS